MTAELYELTDAHWRMPIRVRWVNPANAEVTFGEIKLLLIQERAIIEKLQSTGGAYYSVSADKWYIPKLSLEKIATKSDETDPERLVRWSTPEPDLAADSDFVRAFCKQRGVPEPLKNPKTVEIILGQFNEFMLKWLVSHGRSINFGWGRLDAFPVRPNWKEYIIGRIFKAGAAPKKARTQYAAGDFKFFRRSIPCKTEWLTAYDEESATMRWSVEFTPNKQFHAAAQERERKRIADAKRWKTTYLGQLLKAIQEPGMVERLYENLVAFAKETTLPFGIFPEGGSPRYPPKGRNAIRSTTAWIEVHLVPGAAAVGHEGSALVAEDAGLHAVQDLQQREKDMRDARSALAAAGEGEF